MFTEVTTSKRRVCIDKYIVFKKEVIKEQPPARNHSYTIEWFYRIKMLLTRCHRFGLV